MSDRAGMAKMGEADFPRLLGSYTLHHELGSGGMGIVYLGTDAGGRGVAVKVLQPHIAADGSARARLRREFSSLQRIDDPRVAPLVDADLDGETPYLVTRYVPGLSLDQRVRESGPLSLAEVRVLGRGLGEALDAIHAAGVVHRDLKPTNVLMEGDDPVVIDFGIAQAADDCRLTQAGVVMGTPGYLPPEVLSGEVVAADSDWWAWAATLTYALTGRPPFGRGPLDAVLSRVHTGRPDLEGVPSSVADMLRSALVPDREQRPEPHTLLWLLEEARSDGTGPVAGDALVVTQQLAVDSGATQQLSAGATGRLSAVSGATEQLSMGAATARFPAAQAPVGDGRTEQLSTDSGMAATAAHSRIETRTMPAVAPSGEQAATARLSANGRYTGFGAPPAGKAETDEEIGMFQNSWGKRALSSAGADGRPFSRLMVPDQPHSMSETRGIGQVASSAPVKGGQEAGVGNYVERAKEKFAGWSDAIKPQGKFAQVRGGTAVQQASQPQVRKSLTPALAGLGLLVMALAASFPVWTLVLCTLWGVVARTTYESVRGVRDRRLEKGPSSMDVFGAVMLAPLRIVSATVVTLLAVVPVTVIAVAGMFGTSGLMYLFGRSSVDPFGEVALAAGAAIGVMVAWWGAGGAGLRRGTRLIVRAATPGRKGVTIFTSVLVIVVLYLTLRLQASGIRVNWSPLDNVISDTFFRWW
ncbi:serine/threonine-protein kinase [Dermatophilus congolensis]|uniref:serine/threonine-protein kinase n=1 Tax=Dermatophilus congolensis TaxID=1863 RepID=UPI001AAEF515|nr:serine/threonine-protein kinase [Dermatophilus congolensis]MBO3142078.1 serine/threonine protein kinase [Dermatophilus congolensis]MBO3151069.1 serine/threonine protein kinase [Dermatophilus congolensis]MBO3161926.1 serine/threonine protein kinase [Dermatophilus congolensis]MBO3162356.1 serine/threonine protein kinase [Dermatophilus congolensis]MBO3175910.1 serine/threonine protein kinase [Dermatophilus congolensis]